MSADDRVVVVGGGLSGLLTGVELLRRGADVTVVEASGSPGGVAATVHEAGYVLEPAAGTLLLPHPHLSPILAAAGVPLVEAPAAARRRWVYRHGRLIEMRESPAMIASPVLSIAAKLRVLREPWIGRLDSIEDESLLSFAIRRLGTEAGELLATLMAHGVFAGDPASMSARASFPGLVALEDESSSVIRGAIGRIRRRPRGTRRPAAHHGPHAMSGVATALAAALGPRFRPAWPVTRVTRADDGWEVQGKEAIGAAAVIVALAPVAAAALVPTGLSDVLLRAASAPVAVVGLGGRAADLPVPPGFGFLTGPGEALHALGMLFDSEYAPERAPKGHRLVKAIYGGGADPGISGRDDADLVALAAAELGRAIGRPVYPSWTRVVRHEPGIPQYLVGHPAWLAEVDEALESHAGLHLTGWGYRGIGVASLATDAARVVQRVLATRPRTG